MRLFVVCISLIFSGFLSASPPHVYGYVEKVTLVDYHLTVSAKLDTGAKSASLSAIHVESFKKNDVDYLEFDVPTKNGLVHMSAPFMGYVNIKIRAHELSLKKRMPLKRPVVKMRIRLGNIEQPIMVNLANRKRFIYPLLLGRDAIVAFSGVVDPGHSFLLLSDHTQTP